MPIPPLSVRRAARTALQTRREVPKSRKGGTAVGVARGRDLSSGKNIPLATVRRMTSFFARHDTPAERRNRRDPKSRASIAWGLWGGNAGRRWAKSIAKKSNG
jgi:hypothetical protein